MNNPTLKKTEVPCDKCGASVTKKDTKYNKYVKSPLNYVGGKYKLLPQILPFFPNDIGTFVDVFGGGANVSTNVHAEQIIYNDFQNQVVGMLQTFKCTGKEKCLDIIEKIIQEYNLTNENKEAYLRLREDFNSLITSDYPLMLYTLICHSFNNQIRFNSQGKFNMPFGYRTFNEKLRERFSIFVDRLQEIPITFDCSDFRNMNLAKLNQYDLVYCDPPYLITTATYNEANGWSDQDEYDLLCLLDDLNNRGIRFALSNVLEAKGKKNEMLYEWSKKYNVHYLDAKYKNCNYQRKDNGNKDVEVLITNY